MYFGRNRVHMVFMILGLVKLLQIMKRSTFVCSEKVKSSGLMICAGNQNLFRMMKNEYGSENYVEYIIVQKEICYFCPFLLEQDSISV